MQEPSKKLKRYINNRVKGLNKKDSALKAGYKESTSASVKQGIESKKNYEQLLKDILPDDFLLQALQDDIKQKPRFRCPELNLATKIKGMQTDKLDITSNNKQITGFIYIKPKEDAQNDDLKPIKDKSR